MVINIIQNIITFIAVNLDEANIPNIDEFISEYQQIKPIEDPIFCLSCGAFICLMSGLIFADIMKSSFSSSFPISSEIVLGSFFANFAAGKQINAKSPIGGFLSIGKSG